MDKEFSVVRCETKDVIELIIGTILFRGSLAIICPYFSLCCLSHYLIYLSLAFFK